MKVRLIYQINPFDYPQAEAEELLRVDTEQRFFPDLKIGVWAVEVSKFSDGSEEKR